MIYITTIARHRYGNSIIEVAKETSKLFVRSDGRQYKKTDWRCLTADEELVRANEAAPAAARVAGLRAIMDTVYQTEKVAATAKHTIWGTEYRSGHCVLTAEKLAALQESAQSLAALAADLVSRVERLAALKTEQA